MPNSFRSNSHDETVNDYDGVFTNGKRYKNNPSNYDNLGYCYSL